MPPVPVWTGVPPNDMDRDFHGIPSELADDIAKTMDLEKFAGVVPPIVSRLLALTSAVDQGPDSLYHHLHKLGYNYRNTKNVGKDNNHESHNYKYRSMVDSGKPKELHAKLTELGYQKQPNIHRAITTYKHPNKSGAVHVHTNSGIVTHIQHVVPKQKISLARTSPIKSAKHYTWHVYHGAPHTITNTRGTHSVTLKKGHRFGLRAAKSDPDKVRMIHPETGETIVYSLSKNHATRLRNASREA